VSWINCNDYERGSADVTTAIRLNPTGPSATFEPWSKAPVETALKHGEQQVDRMLHDRPNMGQYGKNADALYQWAARKFAGEDLRRKIFWDASAFPPEIAGGNCSSPEEETGLICVSGKYVDGPKKGKDRTFEELWCNAVFELYNITNADEFWRLKAEAAKGKLSKEDFVTRTIECESRVAEKLRSFYIHVLMPWAKENCAPTHPQCWFVGQPDRAEAYREQSGHTEAYRQWYERAYDETVLDSLFRKGEYQKALDLAKKMKEQANTKEERVVFCRYSADCLLHLNKLFPAIDAYNEVIRFDSRDADAYLGRATAYARLNDMDHAMADFTEAIRLEPSNPEAYELRGNAYEAMGDKVRASADFAMAKQLSKNGTGESAVQNRPGAADKRAARVRASDRSLP
jgi:pentatricopeptide repeat protein